MLRRSGFKFATLFVAGAFIAMGCGGAKGEMKVSTGEDEKPVGKEFEAPKLGSSGGTAGSITLTEEDEKLIVPGSELGEAPPVKQPPKKKRRKKKGAVAAPVIPYSEGIADQMEGLMWGMSFKKVMSMFENKVKETYAEELKAAAGDALAEDGIRTKMLREISQLRKSYIEFKGQRTGYEAHMIASEFTHNNGESMLVWDAGKYVEYLFFIKGRFWKRLRTFRLDSFQTEISFMDFLGTIEARFGVEGQEFFDDQGNLDKIMWRDEETYASAIDGSAFFGVYALRFTAAVTETYIDKLRKNKGRDSGKVGDDISGMVDAVTSGEGSLTDSEASVVDSYTGSQHGGPGGEEMDTTHSVTGQYKKGDKKKEEKKKKEKEKEKEPETTEGTADDIDDLF